MSEVARQALARDLSRRQQLASHDRSTTSAPRPSYAAFVSGKLSLEQKHRGIEVAPAALNSAAFPFQRDLIIWALATGKAALFAGCGLGKTLMELEWARHVAATTGKPVLILAPLAVAQQTVREGAKFGIPVAYAPDQCRAATQGDLFALGGTP